VVAAEAEVMEETTVKRKFEALGSSAGTLLRTIGRANLS
jgi:hypothetical protein